MSIKIVQGDLLKQPVNYIVNAANNHLNHGGGIARAISDAAMGDHLSIEQWNALDTSEQAKASKWASDNANAPLIPTGGAHMTSSGLLPFKGVIHAVGPIWGWGGYYEDALLKLAHENAIQRMLDDTVRSPTDDLSIAFPAISCGIFGFPVDRAAQTALTVARRWPGAQITFALFSDEHYAAYKLAAEKLGMEA